MIHGWLLCPVISENLHSSAKVDKEAGTSSSSAISTAPSVHTWIQKFDVATTGIILLPVCATTPDEDTAGFFTISTQSLSWPENMLGERRIMKLPSLATGDLQVQKEHLTPAVTLLAKTEAVSANFLRTFPRNISKPQWASPRISLSFEGM